MLTRNCNIVFAIYENKYLVHKVSELPCVKGSSNLVHVHGVVADSLSSDAGTCWTIIPADTIGYDLLTKI